MHQQHRMDDGSQHILEIRPNEFREVTAAVFFKESCDRLRCPHVSLLAEGLVSGKGLTEGIRPPPIFREYDRSATALQPTAPEVSLRLDSVLLDETSRRGISQAQE
jgi:hypothetical protein